MVNFLKYSKIYLAISLFVISLGLISIFTWGYNYSIDFVGGTNLEYQFSKNVSVDQIKNVITKENLGLSSIQSEENNTYLIRLDAINEQEELNLRDTLQNNLKLEISVLRSETVGPTIGAETMRKTAVATALAVLGILIYIAWAFKNFNFALAAVIAMLHDVLVVIGTYSIISHYFGAQLDTLFVTALLTTMSFSVHDTIVVFDQIREYRKKLGRGHIEDYANKALTDTMVRSLNNSFTIMFMLLALVLLGGSSIRFFAATLLIGTITGTYSSPFVATPIAVWLEKRKKYAK